MDEIARHHARSDHAHSTATLGWMAAFAAGAAILVASRKLTRHHHSRDSAPGRAARESRHGDYTVTGNTVTINKPRAELYAFWRDFQNLAFMENVEAVEPGMDGHSIWTIAAPAGQSVSIETEIIAERETELIAWRSVEGASIEAQGRVTFRDAPGDRGTEVEAIVAYKPPAGELGRWIAKLFQREPEIQGRRELKRFKMLMEAGEIATAENLRKDRKHEAGAAAA